MYSSAQFSNAHGRVDPAAEKARRVLGWEAQIGVERGIAQTVAWLREQPLPADVGV